MALTHADIICERSLQGVVDLLARCVVIGVAPGVALRELMLDGIAVGEYKLINKFQLCLLVISDLYASLLKTSVRLPKTANMMGKTAPAATAPNMPYHSQVHLRAPQYQSSSRKNLLKMSKIH